MLHQAVHDFQAPPPPPDSVERPPKLRRVLGPRGGSRVPSAMPQSPLPVSGDVLPRSARGHELHVSPGQVVICLSCGAISTGGASALLDLCPPPPCSKRGASHIHRFQTNRHHADLRR
eukprot:2596324-Pyramimonas_sp.AAC.1